VNGISIGFTAHYAAMRERFGAHLDNGAAGENVLVQTPSTSTISLEALQGGIAVRTRDSQLARLDNVLVAEPCVEFTRFALRFGDADRPGDEVTEGLRFLRGGMRGFYATFAGASVVVRPGDAVIALT
jgi:hypothetical protein